MQRLLSTAVALLLASPAIAADATFPLDAANTKITWVGSKPDGKHTGGFEKLKGTATVGDDVTKLKLDVTIATESITSDNEKLTAHLKAPDFFDVKRFPKATFKSTKVEKTAEGYTVTGDLTLLGKTKSVSFPAKVSVSEGALNLDGSFDIDRSAFGMNYGKGKIDDKVALKVAVKAKAK